MLQGLLESGKLIQNLTLLTDSSVVENKYVLGAFASSSKKVPVGFEWGALQEKTEHEGNGEPGADAQGTVQNPTVSIIHMSGE